jgi:hypothetical protein
MTIAWLTHHLPREIEADFYLPGELVGGAEMTDQEMIKHASDDVDLLAASQWRQALDYDKIIITGTDLLTDEAMLTLSQREPIVWVHHEQPRSESRRTLFQRASVFACMSKQHATLEASWTDTTPEWCHGVIDLTDIEPADKTNDALWAARNHPQKGLIAARIYANRNKMTLTEMHNKDRSEVLQAMSTHKHFIFLPKAFDSCPRTLIEAEAADCNIITNELAGRRDEGDLHDVIAAQAEKFWSWL